MLSPQTPLFAGGSFMLTALIIAIIVAVVNDLPPGMS
jgi:hypothetical protein